MKYLAFMAGALGLLAVTGCQTSHEDYVYGAPGQPGGQQAGYGYGPSGDRYRGPDQAPPVGPPVGYINVPWDETSQYQHGYPDTVGRYPFNYSRPPYNQ
jgi:hypothetical protein